MSDSGQIQWGTITCSQPKFSGWTCHLFGAGEGYGLVYVPVEGSVPNAFVRWMMKVCLGCRWVKAKP